MKRPAIFKRRAVVVTKPPSKPSSSMKNATKKPKNKAMKKGDKRKATKKQVVLADLEKMAWVQRPDSSLHSKRTRGKVYLIQNHTFVPFVCYVRDDEVSVFQMPHHELVEYMENHVGKGLFPDCFWKKEKLLKLYTEEVITICAAKTWIGMDLVEKKMSGNSIIVQVADQAKGKTQKDGPLTYVVIGSNVSQQGIYSFESMEKLTFYAAMSDGLESHVRFAITPSSVIRPLTQMCAPLEVLGGLNLKTRKGQLGFMMDDGRETFPKQTPLSNVKVLCKGGNHPEYQA